MISVKIGKPAQNGDYVLVLDAPLNKSPKFYKAYVVDDKAYAAGTVYSNKGRKWLRKLSAVCTIDANEITAAEKELIEENINSENVYVADYSKIAPLVAQIKQL